MRQANVLFIFSTILLQHWPVVYTHIIQKSMNVYHIGILVLIIRLTEKQFCIYHIDREYRRHNLTNPDRVSHINVCKLNHH